MGDLGGRVGEGASMGNDIFSMVLMFSPVRYKFFLQQYLLNFPPVFDFYISGTYFDNWSDGDSCRSLCCC